MNEETVEKLGSEGSETLNTRAEKKLVSGGGKLISIEVVILVITAIVSGGGAFYATRAALEARLAHLEAEFQRSAPINQYLRRSVLYKQISDLKVLEDEITRVSSILEVWAVPELTFAEGRPPGVPPFIELPNDFQWFDKTRLTARTAIQGIDIRAILAIVQNEQFGGIRDRDLVATLTQVSVKLSSYNESIQRITPALMPPNPQPPHIMPEIPQGASRNEVERFFQEEKVTIAELKGLVSGLPSRIKSARREVEAILESS